MAGAVETGFDQRLCQPDFARYAEAPIDRAPLLEKVPVATSVRQHKQAACRVVHDGTGRLLEQERDLLPAFIEVLWETLTVE